MKRWDRLLEVRTAVQGALEEQRRAIRSSDLRSKPLSRLQANPDTHGFLEPYESDLSALFIVSGVKLEEVHHLPEKPDVLVTVSKATAKKCERCWNYREAVGSNAAHPTLCDRCVEALQ